MKPIYVIIYTKDVRLAKPLWFGKQELTKKEWQALDIISGPTFHREDGPAIEFANGDGMWYKDGYQHREDGPAVEFANERKSWYLNGKQHREDGPAIEFANGDKSWYLDDEEYLQQEYAQLILEVKKMEPALRLTDPRQWVREYKEAI